MSLVLPGLMFPDLLSNTCFTFITVASPGDSYLLDGTVSCQVAPVFPLFNAGGPRSPILNLELVELLSVGTGYTH